VAQIDGVGGEIDAAGPQPVFCVGAECYEGTFTCTEYLIFMLTIKKKEARDACRDPLSHLAVYSFTLVYNLPEGVTTNSSAVSEVCPAECSNTISKVTHNKCCECDASPAIS
jgi:hypothetical protein